MDSPAPITTEQTVALPEPSAWESFWRTLTRFESAKLNLPIAARNTLGVILPLVVGAIVGETLAGLAMATGALNVSYSDDTGPSRQRASRMLTAMLAGACATFAGAVTGGNGLLAVTTAALWAFGAGMLVSLSTTAADLGTISLVMLVVYAARPMNAHDAFLSALMIAAGGLLQTGFSLAFWPVRKYEPERRVLAQFFQELAQLATASIDTMAPPPASIHSTQAQQALATITYDHSPRGERYLALLNEAERIRLSLLTLRRLMQRLARQHEPGVDAFFQYPFDRLADLLNSIAHSLTGDRLDPQTTQWRQEVAAAANHWKRSLPPNLPAPIAAMSQDIRYQMDALGGQMRAALELADHATPEGNIAFANREGRRPWRLRLTGAFATLRANLIPQSAAFRHALRLAVCVAIGDSIGRGFSLERSYWLPMTIAIVLKPDFSTTTSRSVLRLLGTILGLFLATVIFHALPQTMPAELILIALFTFLLRWIGPANYGIFVVALSAWIVLILSLAGVSPAEVIVARGLNTILGGVLALIVYWAWPTWERTQVGETLARMFDAYRDYFRTVIDAYLNCDHVPSASLERCRIASRLARSNAEASVDRFGSEPRTTAQEMAALNSILANAHRFIHAAMALEAGLFRCPPQGAKELRAFANQVDLMLYLLGDALRRPQAPLLGLPDLRASHSHLIEAGAMSNGQYALIAIESDRITNSLNTIRVLIERWANTRTASTPTQLETNPAR